MRQILLLFLISSSVFAQTTEETVLQDILKQGKFTQNWAYELNSMKDGKGCASLENYPLANEPSVARHNFSEKKG